MPPECHDSIAPGIPTTDSEPRLWPATRGISASRFAARHGTAGFGWTTGSTPPAMPPNASASCGRKRKAASERAGGIQVWQQGQLQPLGNIDGALNADRLVDPCGCPECDCRRPLTELPDFILETVGDYCMDWPATHHANLVMSQAMPEFIHHADDRLITATSPGCLAGLDASARIATEQ